MSRKVDTSDLTVLSEDDLAYIESRGYVHMAKLVEAERKRRRAAEREQVEVIEVDEPYSKWTVDELKAELKERKLSTEGKKDELVARLEADDAEGDD